MLVSSVDCCLVTTYPHRWRGSKAKFSPIPIKNMIHNNHMWYWPWFDIHTPFLIEIHCFLLSFLDIKWSPKRLYTGRFTIRRWSWPNPHQWIQPTQVCWNWSTSKLSHVPFSSTLNYGLQPLLSSPRVIHELTDHTRGVHGPVWPVFGKNLGQTKNWPNRYSRFGKN